MFDKMECITCGTTTRQQEVTVDVHWCLRCGSLRTVVTIYDERGETQEVFTV